MEHYTLIKPDDNAEFKVGDIISFKLSYQKTFKAIAVKQESDGMLFCGMDTLDIEERPKADIQSLIDYFPIEIYEQMVPFKNGNLLSIPSIGDIFFTCNYCQWEPMKTFTNRLLIETEIDRPVDYWLQEECSNEKSYIATFYGDVGTRHKNSEAYVRPVFKLRQKGVKQ